MAYVKQFHNPDGTRRNVRDVTGAYDPNAQTEPFRYAWLSHQRNRHHWQAWISLGDGGSMSAVRIPERYLREMVADWLGAGKAQGTKSAKEWYEKNKDKMVFHSETRRELEALLDRYGEIL